MSILKESPQATQKGKSARQFLLSTTLVVVPNVLPMAGPFDGCPFLEGIVTERTRQIKSAGIAPFRGSKAGGSMQPLARGYPREIQLRPPQMRAINDSTRSLNMLPTSDRHFGRHGTDLATPALKKRPTNYDWHFNAAGQYKEQFLEAPSLGAGLPSEGVAVSREHSLDDTGARAGNGYGGVRGVEEQTDELGLAGDWGEPVVGQPFQEPVVQDPPIAQAPAQQSGWRSAFQSVAAMPGQIFEAGKSWAKRAFNWATQSDQPKATSDVPIVRSAPPATPPQQAATGANDPVPSSPVESFEPDAKDAGVFEAEQLDRASPSIVDDLWSNQERAHPAQDEQPPLRPVPTGFQRPRPFPSRATQQTGRWAEAFTQQHQRQQPIIIEEDLASPPVVVPTPATPRTSATPLAAPRTFDQARPTEPQRQQSPTQPDQPAASPSHADHTSTVTTQTVDQDQNQPTDVPANTPIILDFPVAASQEPVEILRTADNPVVVSDLQQVPIINAQGEAEITVPILKTPPAPKKQKALPVQRRAAPLRPQHYVSSPHQDHVLTMPSPADLSAEVSPTAPEVSPQIVVDVPHVPQELTEAALLPVQSPLREADPAPNVLEQAIIENPFSPAPEVLSAPETLLERLSGDVSIAQDLVRRDAGTVSQRHQAPFPVQGHFEITPKFLSMLKQYGVSFEGSERVMNTMTGAVTETFSFAQKLGGRVVTWLLTLSNQGQVQAVSMRERRREIMGSASDTVVEAPLDTSPEQEVFHLIPMPATPELIAGMTVPVEVNLPLFKLSWQEPFKKLGPERAFYETLAKRFVEQIWQSVPGFMMPCDISRSLAGQVENEKRQQKPVPIAAPTTVEQTVAERWQWSLPPEPEEPVQDPLAWVQEMLKQRPSIDRPLYFTPDTPTPDEKPELSVLEKAVGLVTEVVTQAATSLQETAQDLVEKKDIELPEITHSSERDKKSALHEDTPVEFPPQYIPPVAAARENIKKVGESLTLVLNDLSIEGTKPTSLPANEKNPLQKALNVVKREAGTALQSAAIVAKDLFTSDHASATSAPQVFAEQSHPDEVSEGFQGIALKAPPTTWREDLKDVLRDVSNQIRDGLDNLTQPKMVAIPETVEQPNLASTQAGNLFEKVDRAPHGLKESVNAAVDTLKVAVTPPKPRALQLISPEVLQNKEHSLSELKALQYNTENALLDPNESPGRRKQVQTLLRDLGSRASGVTEKLGASIGSGKSRLKAAVNEPPNQSRQLEGPDALDGVNVNLAASRFDFLPEDKQKPSALKIGANKIGPEIKKQVGTLFDKAGAKADQLKKELDPKALAKKLEQSKVGSFFKGLGNKLKPSEVGSKPVIDTHKKQVPEFWEEESSETLMSVPSPRVSDPSDHARTEWGKSNQ